MTPSPPGDSTLVRRIAWALAFAGALIFAAMTVVLFSGDAHIRVPAIAALVTFSAVVLSHLGGIEWGVALREERGSERMRALMLALGALPALAAWAVIWLPSPHWQVASALGLFVVVWIADLALSRHGMLPSWFVDLRTAVTAIVALILGIAFFLL